MRIIYSLLTYLIAPFIPLYLLKRGRKNRAYLANWQERFAINLVNPSHKPLIWLHTVSVGETRAIQQLVNIFQEQLPNYQLLITTMTPTGRETAKHLYPHALIHYIPYDISYCVKNFYKTFKPKLGLILETEIWPNLIHYACLNDIPLYLVNARLSNKSFKGYFKIKWALLPLLNQLSAIVCQDQGSLNNFAALGYTGKLVEAGNTKFDLVMPPRTQTLIEELHLMFGERKVICFASTRENEEQLLLDKLDFNLDVIYLFIPRHPERFSAVEKLFQERGVNYQKRSAKEKINAKTKIVLGDSMGEMLAYYEISYLAVIGGSFNNCGGQNPIEALFMKTPVVFGPSMYNFRQVAQDSITSNCALQINELSQITTTITTLVTNQDYYQRLQANCQQFVIKHSGASQRVFALVTQNLAGLNNQH